MTKCTLEKIIEICFIDKLSRRNNILTLKIHIQYTSNIENRNC